MRFAIVIEQAEGNYSAYVPDLPGCVATAPTLPAVEERIRETPFSYRRPKGRWIAGPEPTSTVEYVEP